MTTRRASTAKKKVVEYIRPWLYPAQQIAIFSDARYGVIEASSKSGKTVGCIAWLIEQALSSPRAGCNYWWIAPVYSQAAIAFRRCRDGLDIKTYKANETELSVTILAAGRPWAVLWFKSGEKSDNLYGEDVYAAVIDEASRCREESWHAIRSTLTATRGKIRIIGNVKGRRNWFYHLARRAESGDADMHYARLTAYDAIDGGVITDDEVASAKRDLPENIFKELYLAEPSDDGGNPFGVGAIQSCIRPLSARPPVAWGVDLAKSVDWTVAIGLDDDRRTAVFDRFQAPWQETMTRLSKRINSDKAAIDSTGVGDPIVEALQRDNGRIEGYKFTSDSKQKLMEGLAVAIQSNAIAYPAGVIVNELDAYEYEYTRAGVKYTAPSGYHDDCVCALALAVYKIGAKGQQRARVIFL